jgi:cytochrome c peroxidase
MSNELKTNSQEEPREISALGPAHQRPTTGRWAATALLLSLLSLLAFRAVPPPPAEQVKSYYAQHLTQLHAAITHFRAVVGQADEATLRTEFIACRAAYKPLEFAVEYYYPGTAQRLNGAALPEAEPSEPEQVQLPGGLQALEEAVYGEPTEPGRRDYLRQELDNMLYQVRYLEGQLPALSPNDSEVLDALRLNLYRLASKGISGFDTPSVGTALPEAARTLQATGQVLACYDAPAPLLAQLGRCTAAVQAPGPTAAGFEAFDRMAFFTRAFNPFLEQLKAWQAQRGIALVGGRRAIRPQAATFFAAEAFDPAYFAPADAAAPTPAVLALGAALFAEPALSGRAGRSCQSCHLPEKAYTDGLLVNRSLLDGRNLARNTPTLLNAALQPALFYDSRVHFLEDQVHEVVSNRAEMGGQLSAVAVALRRKGYAPQFARAFADEKAPLTERNLRRALAAYVRTLGGLNSRFDRHLRGDTTALNRQEIQGFNLFMGKGKCGTCHYAPLFSGAVGPLYEQAESEVLGVPATADTLHPTLDPDQGKYLLHGIAHQRSAFKTPTVRNAARTAPYMHNGVYQTLAEVIDFYDRGGGQGLGLAVPTQTLAADHLHLTPAEKAALIAFIGALDDEPPVAKAAARPLGRR